MKAHPQRARPWRRGTVVLAVLAALAAPAAGRDASSPGVTELASMPLDTLLDTPVEGASRLGLRMSESAASVTVVGAAEIRAQGWRTLAEVLGSMRGLSVSDDRSYSYLAVRGFSAPGDYNTRVLLLVDGQRTNDVVYDQAYLGSEFLLDLDLVERVEFIPGPTSAVYGANALFGVVNVVTRRPGAEASAAASLQVGSGARRQLRLGGSAPWGDDGGIAWSASRLLADGQDVSLPEAANPYAPDGVARGADGERRSSLFLRAHRGGLRMSVMHAERVKGAPVLPGAVFGDTRAANRDEQSLADLAWDHALDGQDRLTLRAFAGRYRFAGDYSFDLPPVTLNHDDAGARWWGGEVRWQGVRAADHQLGLGLEWQQVSGLVQRNRDLDGDRTVYLDDRRSTRRVALFAEDQWALSPRWDLGLAGRIDHAPGHGTRFSPRLALLWHRSPELVMKLIHGRAWRPPNAFEAWYEVVSVGGYLRNPALREESVRGTELAAEWRPTPRDRASVSFYRNRAERLLVLTHLEEDLLQFRNLGALRARGLEFEWEHLWPGGSRLRANLSLQQADDGGGSLAIASQAPRRMAKVLGSLPLGADWTLAAEAQGLSRRGEAPGHGLLHLTLSKALSAAGWSASLGVRNVFDRAVRDPGPDPVLVPSVPQTGRELRLRLDRGF